MTMNAAEAIDLDDIVMDEDNQSNPSRVRTECTLHQYILKLVLIGHWNSCTKRI